MARDPQTALMALNRFGFGARGGAAGDLVNAASDPRGFVKAELTRPGGPRLEMPGLQPTPALAQTVFAYQAEVKAKREAAKNEKSKPEARDVGCGQAGRRQVVRRQAVREQIHGRQVHGKDRDAARTKQRRRQSRST